jgi:hypothetical protein
MEIMMSPESLVLPDMPMPEARVRARQRALMREIGAESRAGRRSMYWKVAIPAVAAGALISALAVGRFTADPVSLTSSWTAVPTALGAGDAASAGAACETELAKHRWPITVTDMTTVLAERRGQLKTVLMSGDGQYGMCISGPHGRLFSGVGSVGAFGAGDGLALDGEPGQLNGKDPFRLAYGQVAPDVSSVVIDAADGTKVDATVANGRFFAWWPSGADPATITASASDGRLVKVVRPAATPDNPSPTHK